MKTDGLAPIELQDQREKPMTQGFGIVTRTGQPLRHCKMAGRIHDTSRTDAGFGRSHPHGGPNYSPHYVTDVDEQRHQSRGDEEDTNVVSKRVQRGLLIEPVDKVLHLARNPRQHPPPFDPLKFGTGEYLADHAPERVGCGRERGSLLQEQPGTVQWLPVPSCSLRIWRSNASRRTRRA